MLPRLYPVPMGSVRRWTATMPAFAENVAPPTVNVAKVGPYYALGQFSSTNLAVAAWVTPVAIAATWLGAHLVRVIPERTFFRVVEVALAVISVKLIFEALRAF